MGTIYKADNERLTIAEAKRLILASSPRERFAQVYQRGDGELKVVFDEEPTSIYAGFLDEDFATNCTQLGIVPRWKYRPGKVGYEGNIETDGLYTIEHEEFSRLARLFDFSVVANSPERDESTVALTPPPPGGAAVASAPAAAPPLEHWKMRVQAEAAAEWKRWRAKNCNPTLASIRPHLLKWCRENNVKTSTGKINPSDGYLRTHVLSAKHWTPPPD